MLSRWRGGLILLALFLIVGRSAAQSACPDLIQGALQSIVTSCESVSRNQVCYGNLSLHATPQPDAPAFNFEHVGDVVDVLHLQTLKLDPLDESRGVWGLAMMQLQADIPDTLPGQNVTFLLFGDVEIENRAVPGQNPMQAFYLRSGVGDAACLEAPESGVLIQTPHGVESVHFNINGVDVEVGSTVMLQAQPAGNFTIRTLEGAAVVTMNGTAYPVIAGTQTSLPVDEQMQPEGTPSLPTPLAEEGLEALPIAPLPREIPPPAPLSDAAMMKLQIRVEAGIEPCGVPGLPACEHALAPEEGRVWAAQTPSESSESSTTGEISATNANGLPDLGGNPDGSTLPTDMSAAGPNTAIGNPTLLSASQIPDINGVVPPGGNGIAPITDAINPPPVNVPNIVPPVVNVIAPINEAINNPPVNVPPVPDVVVPSIGSVIGTVNNPPANVPSAPELVAPVINVVAPPPEPQPEQPQNTEQVSPPADNAEQNNGNKDKNDKAKEEKEKKEKKEKEEKEKKEKKEK